MPRTYSRIIRAVAGRPWAILPEKGEAICAILSARAAGIQATTEEIRAAVGAGAAPAARTEGGSVAVIPVYGVLSHRMGLFTEISGGTSYTGLRRSLRAALADPQVSAILLEIDSPGGHGDGLPEIAKELRAAGERKPIGAVANTMAASAAFWLGSQVGDFAVTESGAVGSLGVYLMHVDESALNEKIGIKPTYISAGKYKVEANPDEPLSDEARAYLQAEVDTFYDHFVAAVATGRGVSKKVAREQFGEGRMVMAEDALKAGMVDRIATLDEMIDRMAAKAKRAAGRRATSTGPAIPPLAEMVRAASVVEAEEHLCPEGPSLRPITPAPAVDETAAAQAQRDRDRVLVAATVMEIEHALASGDA